MTDPLRPCENCAKTFQMHEGGGCPKGYKPGTMIKTLKIPPYMFEGLARNTRNFHVLSGKSDVRTEDVVCFQLWRPLEKDQKIAIIAVGIGDWVEGEEWGLPAGVRVVQLVTPTETTKLKRYRESITKADKN